MKKLLALLAALPLIAVAQGPASDAGPGGPANGAPPAERAQRMQKRMQLARTLGLAEALDLDASQALKMRDTLAKFDERRHALHQQLVTSRDVLRNAAKGDKVTAQEVDQALQRAFDARAGLATLDHEAFQAISKDLSPQQRAKAALFLAKFQGRMHARFADRGMGHGMGPGMMGPGMHRGPGGGPGMRGGMGMGPGPMDDSGMMAGCMGGDCPMMNEGDDE